MWCECGLTKKAEPPPTRDVNRDSGTASANGSWLRRLVRHHGLRSQWLVWPSISSEMWVLSNLQMWLRTTVPTGAMLVNPIELLFVIVATKAPSLTSHVPWNTADLLMSFTTLVHLSSKLPFSDNIHTSEPPSVVQVPAIFLLSLSSRLPHEVSNRSPSIKNVIVYFISV